MRSIPNFSKARILCIGDVMLDRFVYGDVKRISPEAPIPVMHINNAFAVVGGAGNVARNLSSIDAEVVFLSVVGDDEAGDELQSLLNQLPKTKVVLLRDKFRKTSTKTRYVSQGQQLLRVDDEVVQPLSETLQNALLKSIKEHAQDVDLIILSDYAKGLFADGFAEKVIAATSKPTFVDPKGHDYTRYRGAALVKPNLKELSEVAKTPLRDQRDIEGAAQKIMQDCSIGAMLITQGQRGMTLMVQNQEPLHLSATAREVFDVSGAGDTVIAILAASVASGSDLWHAAEWANVAAGIVVGKTGTATVTYGELEQTVSITHQTKNKIWTLDDFTTGTLQEWRRRHETVCFTNGCFDLLHLGHLYLLKQSAQFADRLVVAVNADSSVRRLKGDSRPVQSEIVRSQILAALEVVDAVIIFTEETPFTLIEKILPDVLVKGADYTVDTVVGADVVMANGGRVELIQLQDGFSTTSTIKRMQS